MATEEGKPLYHLVPLAQWAAAKAGDGRYFPTTYEQDGFTHLSDNPSLLLGIGNHFYKQVEGAYLVVVLDPAKLAGEVKFEPAAPVGKVGTGFKGDEALFPHLYAPINTDACAEELAVTRAEDGTFLNCGV